MDNSLSFKDLSDIILNLNNGINWYWNFYAGSLIALLTLLSSKKFKLNKNEKILFIIFFLVFIFMNLKALITTGRVISVLVQELQFRLDASNLGPSTKEFIRELSTNEGKYISIIVHALIDIPMIIFMLQLPPPANKDRKV
jgi:hypothetical protein